MYLLCIIYKVYTAVCYISCVYTTVTIYSIHTMYIPYIIYLPCILNIVENLREASYIYIYICQYLNNYIYIYDSGCGI